VSASWSDLIIVPTGVSDYTAIARCVGRVIDEAYLHQWIRYIKTGSFDFAHRATLNPAHEAVADRIDAPAGIAVHPALQLVVRHTGVTLIPAPASHLNPPIRLV
jgi:hypothetical protein